MAVSLFLALSGLAPINYTTTSGIGMTAEQAQVIFEQADLRFDVQPATRQLLGEARLRFRPTATIRRFAIELDPRYRVTGFDIDGVALTPAARANTNGRISFVLPTLKQAGQPFTLHIRYQGAPQVAKRAPWDGGIVWATAPRGEPWIATAVEGEGCDLLWPCIDHPQGKPKRVTQHITVPAGLTAASNGRLLGVEKTATTWTWNWDAQEPTTYAVALNIGPYEQMQAQYHSRFGDTLPLVFYHLRGNGNKAKGLFEELPKFLDFFEEVVGPYPWRADKVGVVETPHLGMEHQTINAYGNDYKKDINGYDWLMNHEFAHEWFGNQVTNAEWDDMWLHEGFAMYMQPLYLEWLRGRVHYDAEMLRQRGLIANKHPMVSGKPRPHGEPQAERTSPGTDIYYKGAWVLHTLRNQIGDGQFRAVLRAFVYGRNDPAPGNFQPRYETTDGFVQTVNRVTGQDWRWFFDAYLRHASLPKLIATRTGNTLRMRWDVEGGAPFPMPVEVRVGERVVTLPMRGGVGETTIAAGESYTLDPEGKVLRDAPEIAEWQRDRTAREQAAKQRAERRK